jgi:hypothetical protein
VGTVANQSYDTLLIDEVKKIWKENSMAYLMHYISIFLERL